MRRLCTLHELRALYTLADLCDFHDALGEWDEAQRLAYERSHHGVD
ncbi:MULTISPECIES: hypothetical protein [Pseudomonas aeruginosa group]|uniref:Uncharacterized protein n=1 Tax=Pseudomonas paraeruginosa TaxID=2994495 RepID=A0A2R3IZ65_9PSED|nr:MULTISPECIES: hypothetical protein [Pseudomonas aeruginosa group]VTS21268.1 Uncharacterised protein [Streptococcus dysgalactiae subsp. equisimilis]AVK07212.1 hypothetical protein CSB93_5822 [Pseudomonas paraeruginosa]AWE95349.1 hypothetical protein CSC28_4620 [Pseudomonas paraeruginosa]MBG3905067.1 hypothetical protein [Pseudomonas aeruginosa]MBG5600820.1 hypothetical protein [Pseudomonas aeruginosa]